MMLVRFPSRISMFFFSDLDPETQRKHHTNHWCHYRWRVGKTHWSRPGGRQVWDGCQGGFPTIFEDSMGFLGGKNPRPTGEMKREGLGGIWLFSLLNSFWVVFCWMMNWPKLYSWPARSRKCPLEEGQGVTLSCYQTPWSPCRTSVNNIQMLWRFLFASCWNPAENRVVQLMEEIPNNQLIWSISHYLHGFAHPRWLFGISSINSSLITRWTLTNLLKLTRVHPGNLTAPVILCLQGHEDDRAERFFFSWQKNPLFKGTSTKYTSILGFDPP